MNHTRISKILITLITVVFCFGPIGLAEPVGIAFTYQGRLIDNNDVADGLYDFSFSLWSDPCEVNEIYKIGADANVGDWDVIDGYFTVELDFADANSFNGERRWLDIGVRPGELEDPNGYTILSPRQEVTPTPYALYALNGGAGGSIWQMNGSDIYYNDGKVGIGTSSPSEELEVADGTIKATNSLLSGVVVHGAATNTESGSNYGGYFEAAGTTGRGVFGYASGSTGRGVYGYASNTGDSTNFGGYFSASGRYGRGVYGEAGGRYGRGVYGHAYNTGDYVNYGGYFLAAGGYGWGVYGEASGSNGRGVYGRASDTSGINYAIYGGTSSSNGYAGYFEGGKNYFEGNVGIGTTSPAETLDVNGAINVDSVYKIGGARVLSIEGDNTFVGVAAGYCNSMGINNTALGKFAGFSNRDGSGNVFLGYKAGYNETGLNKLYIDNSNTNTPLIYGNFVANQVGINRVATTNAFEVEGNASKSTAGDWLANSDARIKADIRTVTGALDTLDKVRLVSFKYTDDYRDAHSSIEDRRYLNVVAQEFLEVFPDYVKTSGEKLPSGEEILQVDAYPLTVYSAAAVQELHKLVKDKDARLVAQDAEIAQLKERVSKMETLLVKLLDEQKGGRR